MPYQVIPFKVSEETSAGEVHEMIVDSLTATFARDFPDRELFVTLALAHDDHEDTDMVQEEIEDEIGMWLSDLARLDGYYYWRGSRLSRSDEPVEDKEGVQFDCKAGFVVLYDPHAITPAIVMPLSVFDANREKILGLLNEISGNEEVDMTSTVSPALYIEAYPE